MSSLGSASLVVKKRKKKGERERVAINKHATDELLIGQQNILLLLLLVGTATAVSNVME